MLIRCFYPDDTLRDFSSFLSGLPVYEKEFPSITEFILGHLTSSKFLPSILTHGLLPDTEKSRSIDDRVPSDSESVYLATTFDRYYLKRALLHYGGEGIIVEVQVHRSELVVDEGQLSTDSLKKHSPEMALYLSMCSGTCKHRGPIPASQILSITNCSGVDLRGKHANKNDGDARAQSDNRP